RRLGGGQEREQSEREHGDRAREQAFGLRPERQQRNEERARVEQNEQGVVAGERRKWAPGDRDERPEAEPREEARRDQRQTLRDDRDAGQQRRRQRQA